MNSEMIGHAGGLESINKVLEVVGVETWENLIGADVRIAKPDYCVTITRIWNKERDVYFDLQEFFSEIRRECKETKSYGCVLAGRRGFHPICFLVDNP